MCSDSVISYRLLDSNRNMVLEGEVIMKKRTLNQTWVLCLRMWRWVSKEWAKDKRRSVNKLKRTWLKENGFGKVKIISDCFFCDFKPSENGCPDCPGKLADPSFSCCRQSHHYNHKPVEFYAELLRLNRIRKEKK